MTTSPSKLRTFVLSEDQWEKLHWGWADVAQWHRGFRSANPEYLPPSGIDDIPAVIADMKAQANKEDGR